MKAHSFEVEDIRCRAPAPYEANETVELETKLGLVARLWPLDLGWVPEAVTTWAKNQGRSFCYGSLDLMFWHEKTMKPGTAQGYTVPNAFGYMLVVCISALCE